ncbi:MAG: glycosyltransferase [Candidatus Kerfeldbacteria bacterium]|nr:glycosyltransferase [Candidatus Kerfeldbacteria bacterium]
MISIIIPVYNDRRISQCIAALERLHWPKTDYEIIVVDNASEPWLKPLVTATSARYSTEPQPGSYRARNTGMRQARGEVLAFLDADCVAAPNWLQTITTALQQYDAVLGLASGANQQKLAIVEQRLYEQIVAAFTAHLPLRRIDTRNFAMRRTAYEKIGGFNETLLYGGDMEYGARLHQAGVPIGYSAAMIVQHDHPTDLPSLLKKRVRQNYGNMRILEIHHQPFIQQYFPQLLRYHRSWFNTILWYSLRSYAACTFPIAQVIITLLPLSLAFYFYKIQTAVAVRLGQLHYVYTTS